LRVAPPEDDMDITKKQMPSPSKLRISSTEMKQIIAEQEKERASITPTPKLSPLVASHSKHRSEPSLSLTERIRERQQRGYKFIENEEEADSYMDALQNSSMSQLTDTLHIVDSMITKGSHTCQELKRQGEVLHHVNHDIHETEKDIDDTSHRLKGMKSLRGKLANLVWRKPKNHDHSDSEDEQVTNTFRRSMTAPMILPSYSSGQDKQEFISEGVKQLNTAMCILEEQQLSIKEEFEAQEKYMNKLDHNMDNVEKSLLNQTNLMRSLKKQ